MSVKAIGWVWDRSASTGNDRLVLLVIADHADHDGKNAWPSVETIADLAQISERTCQRCLVRLEALRELKVERQAGGPPEMRDDLRPNRYTILLAHTEPRSKRATKRNTRHNRRGVSPTSPRGDEQPDIDVVPQVSGTPDDPEEHGVSPTSPRGATPGADRGDTSRATGATPGAQRGATADTRTIHDPSLEPSHEPSGATTPTPERSTHGHGESIKSEIDEERAAVIAQLARWSVYAPERFVDEHGLAIVASWVRYVLADPAGIEVPGAFVRSKVLAREFPPARALAPVAHHPPRFEPEPPHTPADPAVVAAALARGRGAAPREDA